MLTVYNILEIAYQVLDALEALHSIGYVHNDIKPDNIMFTPQLIKNQVFLGNIKLIDFGFATKYISKTSKQHIKSSLVDEFKGNVMFSSLDQMSFQSTSRRDDLISVCYMLLTTLNSFQFPCKASETKNISRIFDNNKTS